MPPILRSEPSPEQESKLPDAGATVVPFYDDGPDITSLGNSTAIGTKPSMTEWKRIPGGFAVQVTLKAGVVVALMRGGPRLKTPPERIEGYGHSTAKEFAWFHVQDGKLINTGSRDAAESKP